MRDAGHRNAAVWTGSADRTDDAWSRQENNLLTIRSGPLAAGFQADFDQLWAAGSIVGTGVGDAGSATAGGVRLGWDFASADGLSSAPSASDPAPGPLPRPRPLTGCTSGPSW